jgi:hypothetical protein
MANIAVQGTSVGVVIEPLPTFKEKGLTLVEFGKSNQPAIMPLLHIGFSSWALPLS